MFKNTENSLKFSCQERNAVIELIALIKKLPRIEREVLIDDIVKNYADNHHLNTEAMTRKISNKVTKGSVKQDPNVLYNQISVALGVLYQMPPEQFVKVEKHLSSYESLNERMGKLINRILPEKKCTQQEADEIFEGILLDTIYMNYTSKPDEITQTVQAIHNEVVKLHIAATGRNYRQYTTMDNDEDYLSEDIYRDYTQDYLKEGIYQDNTTLSEHQVTALLGGMKVGSASLSSQPIVRYAVLKHHQHQRQ